MCFNRKDFHRHLVDSWPVQLVPGFVLEALDVDKFIITPKVHYGNLISGQSTALCFNSKRTGNQNREGLFSHLHKFKTIGHFCQEFQEIIIFDNK